MANSSLVSEIKEKIALEIIQDEALFYAINPPDIKHPEDSDQMINTYIFRYNKNPNTLDKPVTFITIQVHTFQIGSYNSIFIKPKIEIWIYSHKDCMQINNIPKITADRIDYISQLLDEKFNGRNNLGSGNFQTNLIGNLELIENSEGVFSDSYFFRRMIFVTKDINNSLCGGM